MRSWDLPAVHSIPPSESSVKSIASSLADDTATTAIADAEQQPQDQLDEDPLELYLSPEGLSTGGVSDTSDDTWKAGNEVLLRAIKICRSSGTKEL